MKYATNWKVFGILLTLALISIICVFPYILSIQGELLREINQPIQTIFIAQFAQSLILFSVTIYLGLFFAQKINFQLPVITAIAQKKDYKVLLKGITKVSITAGIVTAAAIYVLDILFSTLGVVVSTHQNYAPVWQKLLASVYGGVSEEILMRLFLMSFLIWIASRFYKKQTPSKTVIIVAIVITAVIFGIGHLPITASLTAITPMVVMRAIALNGIGGVVFGWLYWKKGLESAILAHFTADIFLLTILPLLF